MASQVQKTLEDQGWIDAITTFDKGINSSVSPLLLPNDQLSFAINTTVRGGYATHRPVLNKIAITYPDVATQTAIETGNFQGGSYYQPQTGLETLVSQIAGRLFQFTPAATGSTATVQEITIPGDLNPSTAQQAWMWQSEQFLIVNDGQSLPVFFDGNISFRSAGSTQSVVGVLSAGYNSPAVGLQVPVVLNAPFTGKSGEVVVINGAEYRVIVPGTNQVTLVNGVDTVGKVYPIGTVIYSNPNVFGNLSKPTTFPSGVIPAGTTSIQAFVLPLGFPVIPNGTVISITDSTGHAHRFNILASAPSNYSGYPGTAYGVTNVAGITGPITFQVGAQVTNATVHSPIVSVGVLTATFTVPAQGSSTVASILNPYSGGANKPVVIGTFSYIIAAVPPSPPGVGVNLQNINDTQSSTPTTLALGANLLSIPELPAGRMGAYVLGRNWMALTDGRSFIASDIVNGPSGTPNYNYRDSVLSVTENSFLYKGGAFVVPGNVGDIRSITAAVTLDASLGQGPVMIGTPNVMFSCNAPVDRSTWQTVTNPILTESLIGYGPQGQNNTINVNSDILFRSSTGICSLIQGKREFYSWGNTTVSNEVNRVLNLDNQALLIFGSAVNFDNRLLEACGPTQVGAGFYFPGMTALDYFPISNMEEKLPAVYDGLWTGVNAFQWIKGSFSGVERCFAFCFNLNTSKIELYKLLLTDEGVADNAGFGPVPITWAFETCSLFKHIKSPPKGPMDLARLVDGEIYVEDVVGTVGFQAFYKPDQYPCWIPWHSWSICQNEATSTNPNSQPTYQTRMGLGVPDPAPCDTVNNRPLREGYTFQFKLVVTGHCTFLGAKFRAMSIPDSKFARPICNPACVQPVTVCTPSP